MTYMIDGMYKFIKSERNEEIILTCTDDLPYERKILPTLINEVANKLFSNQLIKIDQFKAWFKTIKTCPVNCVSKSCKIHEIVKSHKSVAFRIDSLIEYLRTVHNLDNHSFFRSNDSANNDNICIAITKLNKQCTVKKNSKYCNYCGIHKKLFIPAPNISSPQQTTLPLQSTVQVKTTLSLKTTKSIEPIESIEPI